MSETKKDPIVEEVKDPTKEFVPMKEMSLEQLRLLPVYPVEFKRIIGQDGANRYIFSIEVTPELHLEGRLTEPVFNNVKMRYGRTEAKVNNSKNAFRFAMRLPAYLTKGVDINGRKFIHYSLYLYEEKWFSALLSNDQIMTVDMLVKYRKADIPLVERPAGVTIETEPEFKDLV